MHRATIIISYSRYAAFYRALGPIYSVAIFKALPADLQAKRSVT